jgi:phospholipase D1/2
MASKYVCQLVSKDGKAAATATSAPGCFIHDGVPVEKHPHLTWGKSFSEPRGGNQVDFYVTGEEYFSAVASAIEGASKSIYIAGWQVNFDVELVAGRTLYQYLEKAIDSKPALRIYVMPWMSPKVGVDTGDFETMLAVFQLNAGLPAPRAFALPAIAQSDMAGGLAIGFSHHQKLVVIDDERAFVGGIDLAYGRRDDGRFSLAANGRKGNELYNTCIPPVHEMSKVEQVNYLTRAELLCACFDGRFGELATFATSASGPAIASAQDRMNAISGSVTRTQKEVSDWWATKDLMPEFIRRLQAMPVEAAQQLSRLAYQRLDAEMQGKLDWLRQLGGAHAANSGAALLAWLNNASLEQLPAELRSSTSEVIGALTILTLAHLGNSASTRRTRYENLRKVGKMVPASGKLISAGQPRMPWHDVQASIRGPSVSDLSKNFTRRWNGIAHRYEASFTKLTAGKEVRALLSMLGAVPSARIRIPRLSPSPQPQAMPKTGKSWMQVVRSASRSMQEDEAKAERSSKAGSVIGQYAQNNCLKAMLTAIHGAQHFIYIEGQFFQSAYGLDLVSAAAPSGPMAALIDITSYPDYEKYAKRLGIQGVRPIDMPSQINWAEYGAISRELSGKNEAFLNDLKKVLANLASIKVSQQLGKAQTSLLNPIGEALAKRIEDAICDGEPFHVYMVLPVHPEGTLNTLNIMTQLHLTMQSLVFGSESLVNRIRRAILAERLCEQKKICWTEASSAAQAYSVKDLIDKVKDEWTRYLTLLNLRSWEKLENRPVTEQIYVHSKLLIADDRVAVLGSANINDRSQLGTRDSELAVVVRDDEQIQAKLDGKHQYAVSSNVHRLRVRLWEKLFGMMGGAQPARSLKDVIVQPVAEGTWREIQRVAFFNALAYQKAFPYLAGIDGKPSSIWPAWDKKERRLVFHMPFDERFWRAGDVMDVPSTWEAKARIRELVPEGVQGFIVALPVSWTEGENNISGMNLSLLANNVNEGTKNLAIAKNDGREGVKSKKWS